VFGETWGNSCLAWDCFQLQCEPSVLSDSVLTLADVLGL